MSPSDPFPVDVPVVPMWMRRLKRALSSAFVDFAAHTSSHGIPRAYVSMGWRRFLWSLLFICCFSFFCVQAVYIVQRFQRNDIIVGVEIKFEQIRFPAVTICNMNPYKNSLARQTSTIKSALESFEHAIGKSHGMHPTEGLRKKRSPSSGPNIIAAHVYCSEKDGFYSPVSEGGQECTCATFSDKEFYWNCALTSLWKLQPCEDAQHLCYCQDHYCILAERQVQVEGRWPLRLSSKNGSICISPEGTEAFCALAGEWRLAQCEGCDWWGRCAESFELSGDDCICDDEENCFAVVRTRGRKKRKADKKNGELGSIRVRRDKTRIYEKILSHYDGLLAVYSKCACRGSGDCLALKDRDLTNGTMCLCFYNKKNEHLWPCYQEQDWEERKCSRCSTFGDCNYAETQEGKLDCFCANPIKMCVRIDPPEGNSTDLDDRIVKFWEIAPTTTVSPVQKKKFDREKAYGYSGVKDPIALKSKAMENIMFAVDQLTEEDKWAISYNKSDFILKCSFNGKECHVEQDFDAYLDPTYGACFTYVASKTGNVSNDRAGPAYGLRLEVFVNVTEYLPTTEAAGVRLTVHSHDEQPFPDTLGYSAPTGFVSSFGIRLKSMNRLPAPYGDCVQEGKNADFIYQDKHYSTEGCQRSCIQKHLAKKCGCGDPRFPPYQDKKNCPVDDPEKRACIKDEIVYAAQHYAELNCNCRQPCTQDVYSVSYSANRWPAVPGDQSGCPDGLQPHQCMLYKREQGAMIEVFFEQLNYESLMESEAYGMSNLLSDFGGQLGLWMGVSVITIMEVTILIFDLGYTLLTCGMGERKRTLSGKRSISSLRYSVSKADH